MTDHMPEPGPRRRWPWIALGAVVVVAFFGVWLGVTGRSVAAGLQQARTDIVSALASDAGSGDLAVSLARARAAVERADSRVHDPIWSISAHVPILGRTPAAVRAATGVAHDLLQALAPVEKQLAAAVPQAGAPISPTLITAAQKVLTSIGPELSRADVTLSRVKLGAVPSAVATPVVQLRTLIHDAASNLAGYQGLLKVAPILLGLERPHTWLLLMQNGAEARATGGLIGATGLLRADGGRLTLTRIEPNDVLASTSLSPEEAEAIVSSSRTRDLYGSDLTRILDVNQSPNFAITAKVAMQLERKVHGVTHDGVIAMDEHTMADLMKISGPVRIGSTTVTADSAVKFITRDIYTPFIGKPTEQAVREKDRTLATLVRAVFSQISRGTSSPTKLARVVAAAAADGRISLWSADVNEQALIGLTSIGNTTENPNRPDIQAVIINGGGNKLEAYIQAHVQYSRGTCLTNRAAREARLRVTLDNRAPSSGLPSYVAGRIDLGIANPKPQGSTREVLMLHVPRGSRFESATYSGKAIEPQVIAAESGRRVFKFIVESAQGQRQTLDVRFTQRTSNENENPVIGIQPMALPMTAASDSAPMCPKDS